MPRGSTPSRNRLLIAALAFSVLALGEAVFRLVFPLPELSNFNRVDFSELPPEVRARRPALLNASFRWTSEPDRASFVHALNLYGFRDPRTWCTAPPPRRTRVMFLGDSFVEGVMAADEETIPLAFAAALAPAAEAEVMNLGVGGTGLSHHTQLMATALPLFRPQSVVLVLYANDLPPPRFDPAWLIADGPPVRFKRWRPRAAHVAWRALRRAPVPRRWHTAPFPFFGPVPDPANPLTARPPGYERLIEPALLDAMRRGTFNPYLSDHLARSAEMLVLPAAAGPHLRALRDLALRQGASLQVAYLPHALQVSDHYMAFALRYAVERPVTSLAGAAYQGQAAELADVCRGLGLPFLDLTPLLRREEEAGRHLYWDYDNHMRAAGYGFVGRALARWWLAARGGGPAPAS